jgi:hypothetical protein
MGAKVASFVSFVYANEFIPNVSRNERQDAVAATLTACLKSNVSGSTLTIN